MMSFVATAHDPALENGEQDKSKDKSNDRKGAERKGSRHGIKVSVTSADEVTELGHLDTSDLNAGQKVLDVLLLCPPHLVGSQMAKCLV